MQAPATHSPQLAAFHRWAPPAPQLEREGLWSLGECLKGLKEACAVHVTLEGGQGPGLASWRSYSDYETGGSGCVTLDKILYLPELGFLTPELAG